MFLKRDEIYKGGRFAIFFLILPDVFLNEKRNIID